MIRVALAVVLGAGLAGPPSGEIICDSQHVPVQIGKWRTYVLEHRTRCYMAPQAAEAIQKLQATCDLLITAYGEQEGRRRCQDLVERSNLDP